MKKRIVSLMRKLVVAALVVAGLHEGPKLHRAYLKSSVGDNVVMLINAGGGGGTGWVVNTPNGTQVTVSNKHVCGNDKVMMAENQHGRVFVRVLEISTEHDLCILEPIAGKSGLDLASGHSDGDQVFAIGHPYLLPLHVTYGDITSSVETFEMLGWIDEGATGCDEILNTPYGQACFKRTESILITAAIAPGNSGSPVVNIWGNVVGVAFAGYQTGLSNLIVPAKFVANLIKMY